MLIIGGKEIETVCKSQNWKDTGMSFAVGLGAQRRLPKQKIDLGVIHWTGGEGDIKGLYAVLNSRDLGVEFGIDREGVITQFADPVFVDTWDAGSVNARSWGVEIINYAIDVYGGKMKKWAELRGTEEWTIHGTKYQVANFLPAQITALKELIEVVNGELGIPIQLPKDKNGVLLTTVMEPEELKNYSGIVGHYHITKSKLDPGIKVWWDLVNEGLTWDPYAEPVA